MIPPLYAGKMNKRITFLQYAESDPDYMRQTQMEWVEYKTVWAQFRPIRGREADEAAQKFREERTYKAVTRYYPGIDATFRISYQGRLFAICSVLDPEEQHYKLEIECKEIIDREVEDEPDSGGNASQDPETPEDPEAPENPDAPEEAGEESNE